MLVFWGFVIHVIFLASIFDIYFKSPVIPGVPEYTPKGKSPASRLVLIVGDGLRAESFFQTEEAPYLKSIIRNRGSWGISHTRVPTESRPGHVAIIAGFYEDPSAIAKGWKENPVDFDSVFNKSHYTWSWGSPDILPMFAKGATGDHVETHFYSHEEEDFSGKISTSKLDTWVFENVKSFFNSAKNDETLAGKLKNDKIVFFLHLLGLDTAGHTHKPNSKEYQENIRVVDKGVAEIEGIIEEYFNHDNKTSYIFTADHGMTNWGSHGAGNRHETETPLVVWGAGIAIPEKNISPQDDIPFHLKEKRKDIFQADICPLMSALIGVATPVNSVGVLPYTYLGSELGGKAQALYSNARQMTAQYNRIRELIENKSIKLLFKPFINLTHHKITESVDHLEKLLNKKDFSSVIVMSIDLIHLSLSGLDYYHNYYQDILLKCMTMSFIGWICFLLTVLLQGVKDFENLDKSTNAPKKIHKIPNHKIWLRHPIINSFYGIIYSITLGLTYVQDLPLQYYTYFTLPILLWWRVTLSWNLWYNFFKIYVTGSITKSFIYVFAKIFIYLTGINILVYAFFHRWALSIALLGLAMFPLTSTSKTVPKSLLLCWMTSCLSLAGFSFLPVIGKQDDQHLVAISGLSWFVCCLVFLFIYSLPMLKRGRESKKENITMVLPALMMIFALQNKYFIAYKFSNKQGLPIIGQIISWTLAALCILVPVFSSRYIISRLFCINSCLAVLFTLLSVSHEGFFLLMLSINLFCWLAIEHNTSGLRKGIKLSQCSFADTGKKISLSRLTAIERSLNSEDFRRSFIFLVYIILSFFGTGNIASINSFDPQWVRCFITQFSPFTMTGLILCKTLVPFLCVACTFCAINLVVKAPTGHLFLIVLIFCDLMGLHFLHLVTNKGSWLDIGSSISHYVIMETTVLFLSILYLFGQILTETSAWSLQRVFKKEGSKTS